VVLPDGLFSLMPVPENHHCVAGFESKPIAPGAVIRANSQFLPKVQSKNSGGIRNVQLPNHKKVIRNRFLCPH
jgi:hypothetical protein